MKTVAISKLPVSQPFPSLDNKALVNVPVVLKVKRQRQFIEGPTPIVSIPFVKKIQSFTRKFS